MSRNTRLPNASYELTTTSADKQMIVAGGRSLGTATEPAPCPVIEVALDEKWPAGYRSIEDVVADAELDPSKKAAVEKARRWAASTLYGKEKSLRTLRLSKGLSQARLAQLMGTTQSQIARVENGEVDVQVSTLTRLADALQVDETDTFQAFVTLRKSGVSSHS